MQQYFYPSSAWVLRLWNKFRSKSSLPASMQLFMLGAGFVVLPLAARIIDHHGAMYGVLLSLLAYPGLPRKADRRLHDINSGGSEVPRDLLVEPILGKIFDCAATIFEARAATFVIRDESRGLLFTGSIRRNGTRSVCKIQVSHPKPAPSLQMSPWQAVALKKSSTGIVSTGLDIDGNLLDIAWSQEELSGLYRGNFKKLLISKLEFCERWNGHICFCDPIFPKEARFALRALQQIVEVVVRDYEIRIAERNQARAEERQHIARDLHDGTIQSLCAAEMRLEAARQSRSHALDADAVEALASTQSLIVREIQRLRRQIEFLKRGFYDGELEPRLTEMIREFEVSTGISVSFNYDLNVEIITPSLALELAYLIREGLSNVRKHSGSKRVEIALSGEYSVQLSIQDYGCGLGFSGELSQYELEQRGIGPTVIRERVLANNGTLTITSLCGSGTRLLISLPARLREGDYGEGLLRQREPDRSIASDRKRPRPSEEAGRRSTSGTDG
jgi:signal transduction histidine kinase